MLLKILSVSQVKNEIDIIEAFVRHHVAIIDAMIILDDGSSDGTYELLKCLQAEGLPLIVLRDQFVGYNQSYRMTRLANMAIDDYGADWVFPLDADEFIEPSLDMSLNTALLLWGERLLSVGWSNFVWLSGNTGKEELNPVLCLENRLPPRRDHTKIAFPKSIVKSKNFAIATGSHSLELDGLHLTGDICLNFQLCHYPVRGIDQFVSKMLVSYFQFRSWADYAPGVGIQYTLPYEIVRDGIVNIETEMERISLRYSVLPDVKISADHIKSPLRYMGTAVIFTEKPRPFLTNLLIHTDAMASKIRDVSREIASVRLSLNDLTPHLTGLDDRRRINEIASKIEQLKDQNKSITDQLSQSDTSNKELLIRAFTAEEAYRETVDRLNEMAAAYHQSEAGLAVIRRSLSWRITYPLRYLSGLCKSLRRLNERPVVATTAGDPLDRKKVPPAEAEGAIVDPEG